MGTVLGRVLSLCVPYDATEDAVILDRELSQRQCLLCLILCITARLVETGPVETMPGEADLHYRKAIACCQQISTVGSL